MTLPSETNHPRVGVGVCICRAGKVLLGKRIGAHGAHTWSFPGGHLEFGESVEECARRETMEETGLSLSTFRRGPYTNDFFEAEKKHYATLFVMADLEVGEPKIMEPQNCLEWKWFDWNALPHPLFLPIVHLRELGFDPFSD